MLFVGGCLKSCTEGGGGSSFNGLGNDESSTDALERMLTGGGGSPDPSALVPPEIGELLGGVGLVAVIAVVLVILFLALCFRAWIVAGWIKLHRSIVVEGEGDFSVLFSGASHFLPMLGWVFTQFVILAGSALLASVPGIVVGSLAGWVVGVVLVVVLAIPVGVYVGLGLACGGHAVVLEDLGPAEALGRSWDLAAGNRIGLFVFQAASGVLSILALILGICMLCVGVFVTGPIATAVTDLAFTRAFLRYTGQV